MGWTLADIERLAAAGKIRGYTVMNKPKIGTEHAKSETKPPKSEKKVPKMETAEPRAMQHIKLLLNAAGIGYQTEYRFHEKRKFRFDIAIPELKIAIEYEGLVSDKSRHTTLTGYTRDATKYNLATELGWRVYRYTTKNYKQFNVNLIK